MGSVFCSYLIDNRHSRLRNAIEITNEKSIREIITKNSDLIDKECDRYGNTPLLYAVQNAKLDACRILLELGADANKPNSSTSITPIHITCTLKTNPSSVNESTVFLNQQPVTKNDSQKSSSPILPTNTTITSNETINEFIDLLVKHGSDINKAIATDNLYLYGSSVTTTKLTPLMFAIEQRNTAAIDALIKSNVDINYQDDESHICALHLACGIGYTILIKKLLDNGGNPYLKSRGGNSALHWLSLNNKDEMTSLSTILNHTDYLMNINLQNDNGQTPLMLAAMKNKQNMLSALLDNGASMVFKDNNGQTAMEYASNPSCISLLESFKFVEKIALRKLSKSKLSLNICDTRNYLKRSAVSLTNVSRSYETLSVVEEDFTNRVIDDKIINEEVVKNV
jgi:ankyrin repeat protein